jgi:hypothetical protein
MSPGRSLEGLRFHAQGQVDFRTATAVTSGKLMCGRNQSNSDKQALTDYYLSRSIPLAEHSIICSNWFALCPLRFAMAALESTQFVQFAFPLSNPPFCNSNTPWPSEPSRLIRSLSASGSQKIRRPAATSSRSSHIEAERNAAARAKGTWNSYTESESF